MSRIWLAWSVGVLVIATGMLLAEPHESFHPPTTIYQKTDDSLKFGGVANPTELSVKPVENGYEIGVKNTLTPVDRPQEVFSFDIPDGEVLVTYTVGNGVTPDTISVIVPDGWIALPSDVILNEYQRTTILVTPYTAG